MSFHLFITIGWYGTKSCNTEGTFSNISVSDQARINEDCPGCENLQEAHMAGSTMASPFYLGTEAGSFSICWELGLLGEFVQDIFLKDNF